MEGGGGWGGGGGGGNCGGGRGVGRERGKITDTVSWSQLKLAVCATMQRVQCFVIVISLSLFVTNAEARFNKIHIRKVYACLAVT